MKKIIVSGAAGILLAVCVSIFSHEHALSNLRFNLGMNDRSSEEMKVEETIKLFNRNFASFFNTGGSLAGLNEFPAANMIKRRIFQEISDWEKNNQVIVYDRDVFELESMVLQSHVRAVALAREVWFLNVQDRETRKPVIPGVKANAIRVRYLIGKHENNWRVIEYEVFGENDNIPPFRMDRF